MRHDKLLRRGWAQALLLGYALVVLAALLVVAGLPRP
jgi:NADH:ubiquinone oxidoreductase subunit H